MLGRFHHIARHVCIINGPAVTGVADSIAAIRGDFDNDGFLDLFASNRANAQNNFLYHNNCDGNFDNGTTGIVVNDGGCSPG